MMNSRSQIAQRLIEICSENELFLNPVSDMTPEEIGGVNLLECSWLDSIALVFLQSEIETEWGVRIPASHFVAWLCTLNDIAGHIADKLSGQTGKSDSAAPAVLSKETI